MYERITMKVDYYSITLKDEQKVLYAKTIELNPFIPGNNLLDTKLYDLQIHALLYPTKRKLIGGSAFSGKSRYGATSALQWFDVPNYRCLVLRRTFDDVIATGGIVDYLKHWLEPFDFVEHNQSKRVFHNKKNDAKIFYNYMMYEEDRNKFKSRQYHKIIVDEASEILRVNLQFLNRSLRPNEEDKIPLCLEYISNPADSSGIEYLNENFVKPEGKYPYFEMNFWDNPFVDSDEYKDTLSELSLANFQYQMGNWNYIIKSGDIFSNDMILDATITTEQYRELRDDLELVRLIRGWDIASTDKKRSDFTASTLLEIYTDDVMIVRKQDAFKELPGKLEQRMRMVMQSDGSEVEQWIEHQPAAAGNILDTYWREEFKDFNIKIIPVFRNKMVRAGVLVPRLRNKKLLFLEDSVSPYLSVFTGQAVRFPSNSHTDDEVTHDDRIDSLSLIIYNLRHKTVLKPRRRRNYQISGR
jgi:phage terminase large subunit-like protein